MQYTKPAFPNACSIFSISRSFLNSNPSKPSMVIPLHWLPIITASALPPSYLSSHFRIETFRSLSPACCFSSSMADGNHSAPPSSYCLEKQFENFRIQLEKSGSLRERIRAVVSEIESTARLVYASLLLVHHSRPIPELLEKAKSQINMLKDHYKQLAEILRECSRQYYRYHGDWRSETQTVIPLLTFMHWLETGSLLMHSEAEEKLVNGSEFGLEIEDYLVGVCFMSNELPRYVVNQVTAGNYDCPRNVLKFLIDLHGAFRMLNLRNDFLRKKFGGMKYDFRRVEEAYYDVKIWGLMPNDELAEDQGVQGKS